jgi:hypothetical protein
MNDGTECVLRALLVIIVFVTIFAVVDRSAVDLGSAAPLLGVLAGLGALAALFGALKMVVNWSN